MADGGGPAQGERGPDPLIGRALGEFVIREPLAGGGFGQVYLAEQKALRREVVIKILREKLAHEATHVQRFLREARLATLLDHPYAAHTYAFGAEPDGLLWIAMEHVRGTTLATLLRYQGPIPLERFAPLIERICQVVETAHEQGIVHRDLKPANVMVLSRAGELLPKLLDFGIAKVAGQAEDRPPARGEAGRPGGTGGQDLTLTSTRMAMGSPHYMAPEQWSDAAAADRRADVYALGVLCYQALTGEVPFRAASREQLQAMHATAPVPPLGGGLPRALDEVIARAMAKRPSARFGSALELAAAFRAASGVAERGAPLPRLDPEVRAAAIAGAPQPLARAIANLEAARNPHQARDAVWQVARVATRLVAAVAIAAHRHVAPASGADPSRAEALRRLREPSPPDRAYLAAARALVAPLAATRDAHPVPELVDYLLGDGARALEELGALRAEAESRGGDEARVRELLERSLALLARAVEALGFFRDYPLVVATGAPPPAAGAGDRAGRMNRPTLDLGPAGARPRADAELWMSAHGGARPLRAVFGAELPPGHAALVDRAGVIAVSLWPLVQRELPSPGAEPALFIFDGRGRRGARLVAAPDPFEIEDERAWDALGDLIDDTSESERAAAGEEVCPFPGLEPYTASHARAFVGREREADAFLNRLRVQPLLVVAGPSGAGKSSFVQAAVIPALPDGWRAVTMRPGSAPIAGLAARLTAAGVEVGALRDALAADPDALGERLRRAGAASGPLVLVIDQLEELFTACDDPAERELFSAALARAASAAEDPVRVVMTIRDDFLARAEALVAFRSRLSHAIQILTTPAEPELRRMLLEPLRRAGYTLDDPALADEMVAAVAGAPGALALLSFTASRLWDLRDRRFRQIQRKAYASLGGVAGALAQHAEATLAAMPSDERLLVRDVFRHAVTAEGTRALLSPDELSSALGGGERAARVIEKLVAARLLVVADSELGERIEVTHETLLEAWPRLVAWRREDAAGARLRDLLRSAARQWGERGRPDGMLWRGDALAEYRLWRDRYPGSLTATEEEFARASLAAAAQSRRRARALVASAFALLAAVAVALLILGARAERQRARADQARRDAEESARDLHGLLVSQYEGQGRRLILAGDPLQGLAYLARARELGAGGAAHDFLLAQALRATGGEVLAVEHDHMVARVRFSPDGARLATAGYDEARLWDAETGALIARLGQEEGAIRVAFGPDGALVATGGVSGEVALWDASDGRPRLRLRASGGLQALELSPDGARLLTATASDEVALWDAESGALIARLHPASGRADIPYGAPAALSPDGALVAAGDRGGVLRLWDAGSGRLVASARGHAGRVLTVRFSPDGARLVTASQDDTAIVWRRVAGALRKEWVLRHRDDVSAASFSPDGSRVLTASADQTAALWDAGSGEELLALTGHRAGLTAAELSPDGAIIATASTDGTARLWDAATGESLAQRLGHGGPIRDLAFRRDGARLATASLDRTAIVWTVDPDQRVTRLRGHQGGIFSGDVAPDGRAIATGGADGTARLWDAATGREILRIDAHRGAVMDLRFSRDGQLLASAGDDHRVMVWDAATGEALATLTGHTRPVQRLAWHPGSAQIASAGEDGAIRIWSLPGGEARTIAAAHGGRSVVGVAYSPDGAVLVSTGDDEAARLWDAGTGGALARFEGRGRHAPAFSPDGERVVSLTPTGARIWRVRDGAIATELVGHLGVVQDASWSADGHLVITAGHDGTARIWDARTGDVLAVLTEGSEVMAVRLDPRGRYAMTATFGGAAAIRWLPRAIPDDPALARILACRVPYVIDGDRVLSRRRDRAACRPTSAHPRRD